MPPSDPSPGAFLRVLQPAPAGDRRESRSVRSRRRVAVVATGLVGAGLLGLAIAQPRQSSEFTLLALLLAATWIVGGLLSGPLHLGRVAGRRQVVLPLLAGGVAFGIFALGALIVRHIPALHSAVTDVLARADVGPRWRIVLVTLVSGVAEEIYFRGALYTALGARRPVLWSTVAYVLVTAASGNIMLVFAAAVMGTVFAIERRASGGILAPMITHVTWSALMLFLLPR